MSDFQFSATDFSDSNSFLIAAADKQTNTDRRGNKKPLKTTSSQAAPQKSLTVFSISDVAMNSALMKPQGAMSDIFNRVGQDAVAVGIADGGGVEPVLGAYADIAPTDLIIKAKNIPPNTGLNSGAPYGNGSGAVDPGGAQISSQGWALPVPHSGVFTDSGDFGPRVPPKAGASSYHQGLDLGGKTGDPIRAAKGGVATVKPNNGNAGNTVQIDHGDGVVTKYFHLSAFDIQNGVTVMTNQVIGKVGATGNVTGPHLHFEMHHNGKAIDPAPFLFG